MQTACLKYLVFLALNLTGILDPGSVKVYQRQACLLTRKSTNIIQNAVAVCHLSILTLDFPAWGKNDRDF